jgi:uncharacterized OB-fold protein
MNMSSQSIVRDRLLFNDAETDAVPLPGEPVRLAVSGCVSCGRLEFPGRDLCPACSQPATPSPVGPEATLAAFTAVLHPAPGALIQPPYHIGVARLADRLQVIGLLIDADDRELTVGTPLETIVFATPDCNLTYAFRVVM